MERQQRTRLVTALVLALVFGTGFVVGMAFDRSAVASTGSGPLVQATPGGEEASAEGEEADGRERRGSIAMQVDGLTGEQEARIDALVESMRADARLIRDEWQQVFEERYEAPRDSLRSEWEADYDARFRPRMESLLADTRDAIRAVMSPEQAGQYDSLLADYERKREERRREHEDGDSRRN